MHREVSFVSPFSNQSEGVKSPHFGSKRAATFCLQHPWYRLQMPLTQVWNSNLGNGGNRRHGSGVDVAKLTLVVPQTFPGLPHSPQDLLQLAGFCAHANKRCHVDVTMMQERTPMFIDFLILTLMKGRKAGREDLQRRTEVQWGN